MSDILLNAEEKMMGVIDNLESNLRHIRTGRASGRPRWCRRWTVRPRWNSPQRGTG